MKTYDLSILELYKDRPIDLLPSLPYEDDIEFVDHFDWYKNYGLISDPFPSSDGLENINEEFFEKIIFPTETIEQFKKIASSEEISDLINKNIGIYGAFGSGKTTLLQYFEKLLRIYHDDMIIITIPLEARNSLEEIRRKFFVKLRSSLSDIHLNLLEFTIPEVDLEEDCIDMLKNLSLLKKELFIII